MKILIIGQAPPAVKQSVPYDTTLLYDIFGWIGIDKEIAQEYFEFEAMVNKFPGFDPYGGHLKPSKEEMRSHYDRILLPKILAAEKIIILGNVAKETLDRFGIWYKIPHGKAFFMLHPSRRNYSKIMSLKDHYTFQLTQFIFQKPKL